jgi:hypothetical protein
MARYVVSLIEQGSHPVCCRLEDRERDQRIAVRLGEEIEVTLGASVLMTIAEDAESSAWTLAGTSHDEAAAVQVVSRGGTGLIALADSVVNVLLTSFRTTISATLPGRKKLLVSGAEPRRIAVARVNNTDVRVECDTHTSLRALPGGLWLAQGEGTFGLRAVLSAS